MSLFSLDFEFAVPDVLFAEELLEQHGHLLDMGLRTISVAAERVAYVQGVAAIYRRAGNNDLLAMALARQENCPLVTGDRALREAAATEGVEIRGTIWLVAQMVDQGRITPNVAGRRTGICAMREADFLGLMWNNSCGAGELIYSSLRTPEQRDQ